MQDAIYNQIQVAQNIANRPYEQYQMPTVAELSPLQQQAYSQVQDNQGNWAPAMDAAQSGMAKMSTAGTAGQLRSDQGQYLRPQSVDQNLSAGQNSWNQAGALNSLSASQPYLNQSADATQQAISQQALNSANPYLNQASQSSASNVSDYMNPYNQNVTDQIAKLGARNLSENLLPSVSDSFIKAGQFGGTRMGEFGERAVRDTQDSILNQQAQALQSGYSQALNTSQADLSRQGQLASTAGNLASGDLSRVLQGAGQYGTLGQTAGNLTGQQQQNLTSLGSAYTGAGQTQQQYGLNAAQANQQASATDLARQQSALSQMAGMAQQNQQMGYTDSAALEAAGASQQSSAQQQLTAAQNQFNQQQLYPQQQADWLNTQIRGMTSSVPTTTTSSGTTTGGSYSPSPLSQLASGFSVYKGLTQ
jgi:hypothetical protein